MFLNRKFVLRIIAKFKSLPCLWQKTHPHYHNRLKRWLAHEQMLATFKTKIPDANMDLVKRKLSTMRACYKKELNKVKASIRSGAVGDDIHVPKLWYYEHLSFLSDIHAHTTETTPAVTVTVKEDLSIEDDDEEVQDHEEVQEFLEVQVDRASSPASESSLSSQEIASSSSFRQTEPQPDPIVTQIIERQGKNNLPKTNAIDKEKYASFGDHVAEQLRSMPNAMAIHCKKIINDAIYLAELGHLDSTSRIVSDTHIS